ncbi:hypothetical protein EMPG_14847 [Blastomyces silverae]|uniref:EH domain-containing protein n=1 Tax=Blastomyces silverae TaxID=2060906 RepID=A0A0H1BE22_9EURO|nr:hypothetical protein EMPG_14847 [Blastomyces silverae]
MADDDLNRDSGQRAGSQRPKQPPTVPSKPNVQSAALLGASLAFDAKGSGKLTTSQSANSTRNSRRLAAMDPGLHRFETQDDDTMQQDTFPQSSAGIVGDRIKLFSEAQESTLSQTGSNRRADTARPGTVGPQQIAAELAVGKSTARASPAVPARGSRGLSSPVRQSDHSQGLYDGTSASSIVSSIVPDLMSRNDLHGRQNSPTRASALVADKNKQFKDPRGLQNVAPRRPGGPPRKEHTGSSLPSSSLNREILQPSPPDLQKRPSFSQGKHGPPLPPRLPMATVNKPSPSQQNIPAKNVVTKAATTIETEPNPANTARPTSIRTAITNTGDPRSQLLPSRSSRSSLRPHHSGLSESSLAGALAASSLASSRAPSPSKKNPPPPPPPHRGSRSRASLNPLHSPHKNESRTPSPTKGMRQTLRQEPKSDDEAKRLKKFQRHRIIKTHPNKHREGDRKRWRDRITDRERKRYEGVWAANRGLLIHERSPPGSGAPLRDMVLNLVVRDIWSRSRLQPIVLGQIWDLVCHHGRRMLTRQEFVVGMWLIDQCLKGRKLPIKVSQSVWDSVHIPGTS